MGVRKYRSVEDMPGPAPRRPLDPENLRIACGLMELARGLSRIRYVPGVRRFSSYEAMRRERERQEGDEARRIRDPGPESS